MQGKNFTRRFLLGIAMAAVGLAAASGALAGDSLVLKHVHGISYGQDGKRLFIPSHDGLAIYNDGRWMKAPGPEHDYMGFTGTKHSFYSSGHPAEGSGLVNPFGLMRSNDDGNTWQKLGLEGESDFHILAAGYETNAIYVYNVKPNSRMPKAGIYRTLSDGFTWRRAQSSGLKGKVISLAVHPSNAGIVAAGTAAGLFLSQDQGNQFKQLMAGQQVLAVYFDLDGKNLWCASFDDGPRLYRLKWDTGKRDEVRLPALTQDAVAYVAQNPVRRSELAIATFERNVFVSKDYGESWKQIANEGQTR
jgi:photosystem II stability/assembly factor-like uncharacterized protein